MNDYQIQTALRQAMDGMTGEQLSRAEEGATKLTHRETGQTFCELAAEHLSAGVRRRPIDIVRVMRIAPRYPGLAERLVKHFPDEQAFKDIAEGRHMPLKLRDPDAYVDEMCSLRDALADKIGPAPNAIYAEEMVAGAEQAAVWIKGMAMAGFHENGPELHLREERVDALATLLSLFANSDAAAAVPVE